MGGKRFVKRGKGEIVRKGKSKKSREKSGFKRKKPTSGRRRRLWINLERCQLMVAFGIDLLLASSSWND